MAEEIKIKMPKNSSINNFDDNSSEVSFWQLFKLLVLVSALFAFLFVALLLSNNSRKNLVQIPEDQNQEQTATITARQIEESVLPKGFPEDFPTAPNTKVLENFEILSNDNKLYSRREFTSSLAPDQLLELYEDFFMTLGWQKTNNSGDVKLVLMKKNSDTVLITASKLPKDTVTTASVNFDIVTFQ